VSSVALVMPSKVSSPIPACVSTTSALAAVLKSAKRGGDVRNLTLDEQAVAAVSDSPDVIELDMALTRLAGVDQGLANAVELVFFGGLTYAEAATALGVSKTTLFDDLKLAKAWLKAEMPDGATDA